MSLGFGFSLPAYVEYGGRFGAGSTLLLNFTSGNQTLDPRITFSRASNATLTNSAGVLTYAPHNLLTFSEQFDNAAWLKVNATVTANAAVAPDGTTTADLFSGSGTGAHYAYQSYAVSAGVPFVISVYAKNFNLTGLATVWLRDFTEAGIANFNLATGTIGAISGIASNPQMVDVGGGWYKISATFTPTTSGNHNVSPVHLANSNTTTGFYAWGAQLNVGSLQPYYTTTGKNLLGFTQEFDNAAWTKSNSFVQTNQIRNNTMQGAVAGTPGTSPSLWQPSASGLGVTREIVGIGVENGISYIDIRYFGTPSSGTSVQIAFDAPNAIAASTGQTWTGSAYIALAGGSLAGAACTFSLLETNGTGGVVDNSKVITPTAGALTGNRDSLTATLSGGATVTNIQPRIRIGYTVGTPIDITLRIGMPQLVQGAVAGDVVATYGTARAVMYPAPDGSVTADKLVENNAFSEHTLGSANITWTGNGVYTASFYAKAAERFRFDILFGSASNWVGGNTGRVANFDLQTGTVATTAPVPVAASMVAVGNGWYRCRVTVLAVAAPSASSVFIRMADSAGLAGYQGDGTSGIFIWGAQLSDSASLDPYVYNPVAAPTAAAYYGPRFDYDPVTLAPRGLLIEEQRTNLLTWSEAFDNAIWTKTSSTITANAAVSPNGDSSADRITDSVDGAATAHSLTQTVSFTTGVAYTQSVYAKQETLAGIAFIFPSAAFTSNLQARFNVATGTVGLADAGVTASISPAGNGWFRCVATATATATVSAAAQVRMATATSSFYQGNGTGTVLVWGAQLEVGAFPTSYIPTTTAAATRAADVAVMQGANFSNWYNQTEGAIYGEFAVPPNLANFPNTFGTASDGTTNNQLAAYAHTSGLYENIRTGGVVQGDPGVLGSPVVGANAKFAFAYQTNNCVSSWNGVNGTVDTSVTLPTVNQFRIGTSGAGTVYINGWVRRIAYYPRRLANSELQGITA